MLYEPNDMTRDKRTAERLPAQRGSLAYTSFSNIPFNVTIANVSRTGAFVMTPHLPRVGERVVLKAKDIEGHEIVSLQGTVRRVRDLFERATWGFGLEFDAALSDREIELLMASSPESGGRHR